MASLVATIGETFTVRNIAAQDSWETLIMVTSRTHAFRAITSPVNVSVTDVQVNLVHADPELTAFSGSTRVLPSSERYGKQPRALETSLASRMPTVHSSTADREK